MNNPYIFRSKEVDGQSVVHLINLFLGEDIIGAEIGIGKAQTFCTFLQNCSSIKTLYGIDSYKPYSDFVTDPYDENIPKYTVDEKTIDYIKLTAYHNIQFSGCQEKVIFIEEDSHVAVNYFEDNLLDFIFIDTYMTYDQAYQDLVEWYPKVKTGGLFIGHDWSASVIRNVVNRFREEHKITNKLSTFDNTWAWVK
jgi:hypothetical protein